MEEIWNLKSIKYVQIALLKTDAYKTLDTNLLRNQAIENIGKARKLRLLENKCHGQMACRL